MAGYEDSNMRWGHLRHSLSSANDLSCAEGDFAPPEIKAEFARSLSLRIPRSDRSPLADPTPTPLSPTTLKSTKSLRRSMSIKKLLRGGDTDTSITALSPSKLSPRPTPELRGGTFSPSASPQIVAATPPSPIGSPGGVAVPSPASAFYGSPTIKLQSPLGTRGGGNEATAQLSRLKSNGTVRTLFERRVEKQRLENDGGVETGTETRFAQDGVQSTAVPLRREGSRSADEVSNSVGDVSRLAGNVSTSAGHVSRSAGDVSTSGGDVSNSGGDVSKSAGDVSNVIGDVSNSAGDVSNPIGGVSNSVGDVSNMGGRSHRVGMTDPAEAPAPLIVRSEELGGQEARPASERDELTSTMTSGMTSGVSVAPPEIRLPPGDEQKLSDVVNSTNEEVFRSLLQNPPERGPSSGNELGSGGAESFTFPSPPAQSGPPEFSSHPLTPASATSEPPWGGTSSTDNTPTPQKVAKPGHQRGLSLSNSAPLMVTPPEELTSEFANEHKIVQRSNSSLEARALLRLRQDQFIQQILRSNTVIGKDYTIKVDVSSAHIPGFGSFDLSDPGDEEDETPAETPPRLALTDYSESGHVITPLTIAILIVGTRGDVQPFIAIGKKLLAYGHRVRLATHANYREFVTEQGLEFFPLGGDPKILAEYMVKNKGFLPSWPSEVKEQRRQLKSIIFSTWDACTSPDWESNGRNFIAEAIIANPPVYGHIHVAERLKIPLHMIFTMPWSPTGAFPHPLARLTQYAGFENRLSYAIVDSITWLGVRDIINSFRKKKLKLPPISLTDLRSKSMLQTNRVPFAYIWSPSLVPKPKDWGSYIDVVGFCFLDLATDYKPPADLAAFLKAGSPPVFVGFGSLPVGDPQKMTAIIFEALRKTGMRGIVQKGWGGLGEGIPAPPYVYIVGNCPHDWLFPQCSAVVHHGGAGTTAAGLLSECPTTVVPFFGDQPFWGDAVFTQGVGPKAIPVGDFSLDRLVKALEFMARPQVKEAAVVLASRMRVEDGVEGAVRAFHKHLPKDVRKSGRQMLWGLSRKHAARAKSQPRQCGCFG